MISSEKQSARSSVRGDWSNQEKISDRGPCPRRIQNIETAQTQAQKRLHSESFIHILWVHLRLFFPTMKITRSESPLIAFTNMGDLVFNAEPARQTWCFQRDEKIYLLTFIFLPSFFFFHICARYIASHVADAFKFHVIKRIKLVVYQSPRSHAASHFPSLIFVPPCTLLFPSVYTSP